MFDLIVRNANLPDGRKGIDIGIQGGKIITAEPNLQAQAQEEIDATGRLVSPPFVDPHFHMDATLSLGLPRMNVSGTLLEGIALWGELRPIVTKEELVDRALRYCDLAVTQGLLFIRSHVDTSDPRLVTVEAMIEVREKVAPYIDLQLVAFPQDGYYRSPGAIDALDRALDMGVDIVGGIPHFERTMGEGTASVEALCRIAADRGLPVDIHCDETDDPLSRHIETLAAETIRFGLQGRVAGSHLTSMHSMDNYYVSKLIPLMAEAEINVIPNPLINIMLQGRHDTYPKRRGMTRVRELMDAGLNVSFGHDCVMDPWYSMGSGDMLEVGHMAIHVAQMAGIDDKKKIFDALTVNSAKTMGLAGYGLEKGCSADLVILQASDTLEALRLKPNRLAVIRRGKVIARSAPRIGELFLDGRPARIDGGLDYAPRY
ncbi:amidohydrolase family protein [Rhizobium ruizarguesonis]|jgi:cytosine deaminase|uniref:amidohydrolase family protein n=1 Tax=Rhizobium ruizarguesonis TaxID=2081791 RepID=UPI001031C035|nr:amidohydrolase family protein [Rhizobium ruizarguesonis]MBY5830165.1 amidohydrolase family protein [Rhizobium leguminosarum]NKJ76007.1 amidohydrolase family protein [Rhizobium leguminosarum bv. viciae]MBC2807600.1 amidohydrolase family protein [Rhizobium ruizarguesonis]MBY5849272.1 amidohydrolase family protein [Rhizobium leguminosarum]MBY5858870.1 amidohydrolase family protein [Rhizobium leguminosarum]